MPSKPLLPKSKSKSHRMSYRIGRGETSVLTFEPYKSDILPLWRFKTPEIARTSSRQIYDQFEEYGSEGDFVGMDMCRKFLQMGMTRAKRYANHAGGRKYDRKTGKELEKSTGHKGREEKLEASKIFREVWERARRDGRYAELKEEFREEQRVWDRELRRVRKEGGSIVAVDKEDGAEVKNEIKEEED